MIAETFIRRPVTAIVCSVVIVLIGVLAILNLPITQYPQITPPTVSVSGTYVGADAETVEQTVATPVEVQVNGTPGMTYLTSTSANNGQMSMSVNFDVDTDIDVAALDVQNRVGIALPRLPQEVQRLGLTVRKRNPSILMLVALYAPKGTHNITFLDNYANIYIKDALLRTKGVGDINARADDFSMRIWLKPDKLAQLGVTAAEVTAALQEQNAQIAAGSVGAMPQQPGQSFEYAVTVRGRLVTPEEFSDVIVKTRPEDGSVVYLRDVARVELGKYNYNNVSFVDGKRAAYLLVYQAPGSNALETYQNVEETMEQLKKQFPADLDYMIPFEAASVVKVSIKEVFKTMLECLVLVVLVVYLFLQSWRATLIPALVIPVAVVGPFMAFVPLDFTINTLTLFGLVLAIGIVVDDAIVVVEAVQLNMDEKGMNAREATLEAMREISTPVVTTSLILIAVFVPVAFIPGITGRLYQQFALTIAVSVLISTFAALSFTPALCALILKPRKQTENQPAEGEQAQQTPTETNEQAAPKHKAKGYLRRFFDWFNRWFGNLTNRYTNGVEKGLNYPRWVLAGVVAILVGTVLLYRIKPSGFIPTEDEGRLIITFTLPEAASTGRTVSVLQGMMKELQRTPGVNHFSGLAGLNAVNFSSKSNSGTIFCQLKPWDERKDKELSSQALVDSLQRRFAKFKEARVVVIPPPAIPGLGNTSGFSFILQQRESTTDIKEFDRTLQRFLGAMRQRPEIAKGFSFFTTNTPGYKLEIDREKCKKLGVQVSAVGQALQTYLGSAYVNDFTLYGRTFRVVAQADTSYRGDIQNLDQYYVRNQNGGMVPLSTLVSYTLAESAPLVSHYNLFRSADINGDPGEGYSTGDAIKALEEVATENLPPGYGYEFSGLSREEKLAGSQSLYIFGLSLVFVFLVLAALYESWSVPFAVLVSVPISALGAILTLSLLPNLTNNVYAQIGLVTLVGLAGKNAILIVEYAKERVDAGTELVKATLEAVRLRFRPIVMTSMSCLLGVVPLMIASGAGAESRKTIGWTIFGGMLVATTVATFIVAVCYVFITRKAYGKQKLEELEQQGKEREEADKQEEEPQEGDKQQPAAEGGKPNEQPPAPKENQNDAEDSSAADKPPRKDS
ncbi:multidrug efflux RND transporter permease subunit [Solirubrum puertoriconensis]|uniref:multidrug efflux RND transporter permease subunit n=1 Tax=Solirubrum puertoriconensis TaxID=1751427 RepID=UPI00098F7F58|nr:multidrug efflux RND transporter permease subunit [Solirubrum puertoriconensis]